MRQHAGAAVTKDCRLVASTTEVYCSSVPEAGILRSWLSMGLVLSEVLRGGPVSGFSPWLISTPHPHCLLLAIPKACGRSQARDQARATAVPTLDP